MPSATCSTTPSGRSAQLDEATAKGNQAAAEVVQLRSQLSTARDRINSQATKLTAAAQQVDTEQQVLASQATAEQQVQEERRELQDVRAAGGPDGQSSSISNLGAGRCGLSLRLQFGTSFRVACTMVTSPTCEAE